MTRSNPVLKKVTEFRIAVAPREILPFTFSVPVLIEIAQTLLLFPEFVLFNPLQFTNPLPASNKFVFAEVIGGTIVIVLLTVKVKPLLTTSVFDVAADEPIVIELQV